MVKKIVAFLVVAGVVVVAGKKLVTVKQEVANAKTPLMLNYNIEVQHITKDTLSQKRDFLASVESGKEIKVATKLSGNIKKVYVSESDFVKKGDILVKIDDRSVLANLKTLKKNLHVQNEDIKYYEDVLKRDKKLFEANALSKEKYDASVLNLLNKKAQRDATKDKINSLKSDISYLTIKAPFDGVVSNIFLHVGDLAVASKPILSLNSFAKKVTFTYAPTKQSIKVGDEVFYGGVKVGKVKKIYPNAKNNLYVAEVLLEKNIDAKSGSFISIAVSTKTISGCSVSNQSLLYTKDATYVLAYNNHKFEKVKVDVLLEGDDKSIIDKCLEQRVAVASESKLSVLPFYDNLTLVGDGDE